MIQCPVCKSMCFDDMEICYGCMHRFDDPLALSDGYTASGLPEFEVEEPVEDVLAVPLSNQVVIEPASFVIPASNQGYTLSISIRPIKDKPEAITTSGPSEMVSEGDSTLPATQEAPDTSLCLVPA